MLRGTYIGNSKMLIAPYWGGKMVAPSEDLSLMPDLVIEGSFDTGLTNYILSNITEGMTVFDVGANIGYITLLLGHRVKASGKVYAYECSPKNIEFLYENITMNYHSQTTMVQNAVSNSAGEKVSFYEPTRFRGSGSLRNAIVNSFKENVKLDALKEVSVVTVTIDHQINHFNIDKVDFLKMDIEGMEYAAFQGMKNSIEQGKIKTIAFEINSAALEDDKPKLLELMQDYRNRLGAKFYTINLEGETKEEPLEIVFERPHTDNLIVKFN